LAQPHLAEGKTRFPAFNHFLGYGSRGLPLEMTSIDHSTLPRIPTWLGDRAKNGKIVPLNGSMLE
jgi:hypothetical protein